LFLLVSRLSDAGPVGAPFRRAQRSPPLAIFTVKEEDVVPGLASEHVDEVVRLCWLKLDSCVAGESSFDEESLRLGAHRAFVLIQFRARDNEVERHATSCCPRQNEHGGCARG